MSAAAGDPMKLAYQVKNWSKYNESLVSRRDITLSFSDEDAR